MRRPLRSWARAAAIGLAGAMLCGCDGHENTGATTRAASVTTPAAYGAADIARWSADLGTEDSVMRRIARASPLPEVTPDPTNQVADDARAAELGRRLFFDRNLSGNGSVSCASCHDPGRWFTDGLPRSKGIGDTLRNAPTLVDATHQRWFNWDGRSDSMWSHAIRPIEHPDEMGGDRTTLTHYVLTDPELRPRYEAIFGDVEFDLADLPARAQPTGDSEAGIAWKGMSATDRLEVNRVVANVGKALAAYQRTLVGGRSKFDRWVDGLVSTGRPPGDVLNERELAGMKLFFGQAECWECHAGPLFSDGEFHNIGLPVPGGLPRDPGRYDGATLVRNDPFNAAGDYSDQSSGARAIISKGVRTDPGTWGAFRTPSLRHVAETGPYMHDGSMESLRDVVKFYSELEGAVQLDHHQESVLTPLGLTDREIDDLVAFLETLTGDMAPQRSFDLD